MCKLYLQGRNDRHSKITAQTLSSRIRTCSVLSTRSKRSYSDVKTLAVSNGCKRKAKGPFQRKNTPHPPLFLVLLYPSLFSVPAKLTNVSRNQTVLEGSNMTFVCEATGRPSPNITWNRVLEDGSNGEVLQQGPAWDFLNINRTASGTYRCTAYNGFGSVTSQAFKVNVVCTYFTCLKHCFTVNRKSAPCFSNQPNTVHIFNITDISVSSIHSIKTNSVKLLYNFG